MHSFNFSEYHYNNERYKSYLNDIVFFNPEEFPLFEERLEKILENLQFKNDNFSFKNIKLNLLKISLADCYSEAGIHYTLPRVAHKYLYEIYTSVDVIDIYTGKEINAVFYGNPRFSPRISFSDFLTICRKCYASFILHELDESLYWGNNLIFNQHGFPEPEEAKTLYHNLSRELPDFPLYVGVTSYNEARASSPLIYHKPVNNESKTINWPIVHLNEEEFKELLTKTMFS